LADNLQLTSQTTFVLTIYTTDNRLLLLPYLTRSSTDTTGHK